jgi:hypothetical protein
MARLPFFLGGNEVHNENPAERLRREAEERRARALLSQAAAMGRITPSAEVPATPPAQPAPAATTSASTTARVSGAANAPRGSSRVTIPSARARLLEVMAAESPRVAAYLRESMGPELEAAQQEAGQRRLGVNLGRAGAMLNEAISGARYDRGAYDALAEEADRPVTDLGAREGQARQEWQDTGAAQDRQARLQGAEDERVGADYNRRLAAAQDARSQEQRVEDATRSDARFGLERQDDLNARAQQRAQWETEMELKRRDLTAKEAKGVTGGGADPKALAELAQRSQPAAEMLADIETVNHYISSSRDIPGVGVVEGRVPEFLRTQDGNAVWQSANRLASNIILAKSGKAATDVERRNMLEQYGIRPGSTDSAFVLGMQALTRDAAATLGNIEAGFDRPVVEQRRALGGVTSRDIPAPAAAPGGGTPGAPSPTGRRATMPDGSVWEELSDGSSRQVR